MGWEALEPSTNALKGLRSNAWTSFPQNLAVFNQELCFRATADGLSNWELWSLTVGASPQKVTLLNPALHDTEFTFSFLSQSGRLYEVQFTNTLSAGTWAMLTNLTGNGSTMSVTNQGASSTNRFYRIESK